MKSKLEIVYIEKIDNGYVVEVSFNDIKEDESKEWRTVKHYCGTLEEILDHVKGVLIDNK